MRHGALIWFRDWRYQDANVSEYPTSVPDGRPHPLFAQSPRPGSCEQVADVADPSVAINRPTS